MARNMRSRKLQSRNMQSSLAIALVSALAFGTGAARADVQLTYGDAAGQTVSDLYVGGGAVRMERATDRFGMLVDTTTGTMTMIDHARRTCTVMDRATLDRIQAQITQMREQVKAQLASLPPAQRAMVEQQMGAMLGGAASPTPEFRRTGERRTIQGHECETVEGTLQGRPMLRACVVDADSLDVPAEDAATLEAFTRVMAENAQGLAGGAAAAPASMTMRGVPVETVDSITGRVETLSAVQAGAVDGAWFRVPAGYAEQKIEMPGSMGGMGMPMPR